MALFPAFIDITNKAVLVVGAGNIALHKIKKLLPFEPNLTVVAPEACSEVHHFAEQGKIDLKQRIYQKEDLNDQIMVIVAVDDLGLQEEIFLQSKASGVLCNSVDSTDYCQFIFPSLIVRQDLSLGISTSGKAPALSAALRRHLEKLLPEDIDRVITEISTYRDSMPKGPERMKKVIDYSERLFVESLNKSKP